MKPILSYIIPCYNSASTLGETLVSVANQHFEDWEALIVNDGSPDHVEEIALQWVEKDTRFKYFKKVNGGLGSARNYGLEKAEGKYIVPLDSDNLITPDFAQRAIEIFDTNDSIGVIYGNAEYFGEREGLWNVGKFDKLKMLRHNYIDACAMIRKSLFDKTGGYDEKLPFQGHEDWDFWLRVMQTHYKFYYLPVVTFQYRVTKSSMIRTFTSEMLQKNIDYIKTKNRKVFQLSFFEHLINVKEVSYHRYKKLKKRIIKRVKLGSRK